MVLNLKQSKYVAAIYNCYINLLKPGGNVLLTSRFNIKKSHMVFTLHLCVIYGSQGKRLHLLHSLTDWLCITEVENVYSAVRTESYIKQTSFVLKWLNLCNNRLFSYYLLSFRCQVFILVPL